MSPLDLVKLAPLMQITSGRPEILIGLLDGPVDLDHPELMAQHIRELPSGLHGPHSHVNSTASMHGTFVAGMLCAKRDSAAPAICPGCTLLLHPIFTESSSESGQIPSVTPEELAAAIIKTVDAGARVLNLSIALGQPSMKDLHELEEALDYAASRGVISVAAAGNQGMLGSSAITRHPWVIPVAACDLQGKPMSESNLGRSIGRRGLRAPGDNITSLGAYGRPLTLGGTSVATPFVTGTIALLWSEFPMAAIAEIRLALAQAHMPRRNTVVPPLLDAWAAYQAMVAGHIRS
jgi:subtilisin family serine protease